MTWRILDRSITNPLSHVLKPARLCPPQRTAVRIPASVAARTALCTSLTSAQRAIEAWCASYHAIPDDARLLIATLAGAQQVTFEMSVERRIDLFAGFDQLVLSLQNVFVTREGRRFPKSCRAAGYAYKKVRWSQETANAGTDHRNPSTKKVVTEIATSNRMPIMVNNG